MKQFYNLNPKVMKPSIKLTFLGVLVLLTFFISATAQARGGAHITFQTFYNELSPHGRWIHDPHQGYIWLPYAEPDFQPYATRGHWVVTEFGNTWVSDYSWGWAPFHYGRWFYDDFYGWAWVPGTEWGPAWVHWRSTNGYYGWAPLGPGMHINVTINIPVHHWVFVPHIYITSPRIYHHYIPRRNVVNVYNQSVVINNVYTTNNYNYISGPSRREIERATRRRVTVRTIDHVERPDRARVNNSTVRLYRPSVSDQASARPSRVSGANTRNQSDRRTNHRDSPSSAREDQSGRMNNIRDAGSDNPDRRESAAPARTDRTRPAARSSRNQRSNLNSMSANNHGNRATREEYQNPSHSSSRERQGQFQPQRRQDSQQRTTIRQQSSSQSQTKVRSTQRRATKPASSGQKTRQQSSSRNTSRTR